ncbi:MAG TPA: hypothetical protein VE338_11070 [Ktedonobacterales bacterium]|jgi:hypothetical protein|nr:hypothetical protein [Ktedonobacterales bacterium]
MISHEELATSQAPANTETVAALTAEEMRRLDAFQRSCDYQPQYVEWELNPRRLEFARWLVQHGRLSEDLEQC